MKKLAITIFTSALALTQAQAFDNTYMGVTTGFSHVYTDQYNTAGTITLANQVDESGYNVQLEYGYHYSNHVTLAVNYERVEFSDTHMDNLYISSEYKLKEIEKFKSYLGAELGYSRLNWDKKLINASDNDFTSGSYLLGVKLGALYSINEKLDFNMNVEYKIFDHDMNLESGSARATINHDALSNVNFGVRYSF